MSPPELAWRDRLFCMVGPDCVRRHLVHPLLDRFAAAGFEPVGWRLAPIGPGEVDRMSEQGTGVGPVYRYRALDALFALGPALTLVLADRRDRPVPDRYAAATALKGHADPYRATPGTIRRDLGALNVVLNLLHVSDSPICSAREAAILTGCADPAGFSDAGDLAGAVAVLEAGRVREVRGATDVRAALRGRLLGVLWQRLTPAGRRLAASYAGDGRLGEPEAGAVLARQLTSEATGTGLTELLAARFDGAPPRPDLAAGARRLAAHGVGLDDWEHAVLVTSSYFTPRDGPQ